MTRRRKWWQKDPNKKPGFWAEVGALRRALEENVRAGQGKEALRNAVNKRTLEQNTVQAETKGKQQPAGVQALLDLANQSPGGQAQVSAKEYRRLMGLDPE